MEVTDIGQPLSSPIQVPKPEPLEVPKPVEAPAEPEKVPA